MNQNTKDYITQKVNELINAPSCCQEAKTAAQNWLKAVGTDDELNKTKELIKELEQDIMPIDVLIDFVNSENGIKIFGEERAENMLSHARKIKADGAKYCDCPACTASAAILEKKNELI